jgi:hypothetical protein
MPGPARTSSASAARRPGAVRSPAIGVLPPGATLALCRQLADWRVPREPARLRSGARGQDVPIEPGAAAKDPVT